MARERNILGFPHQAAILAARKPSPCRPVMETKIVKSGAAIPSRRLAPIINVTKL